jgi:hypothetical protein
MMSEIKECMGNISFPFTLFIPKLEYKNIVIELKCIYTHIVYSSKKFIFEIEPS